MSRSGGLSRTALEISDRDDLKMLSIAPFGKVGRFRARERTSQLMDLVQGELPSYARRFLGVRAFSREGQMADIRVRDAYKLRCLSGREPTKGLLGAWRKGARTKLE